MERIVGNMAPDFNLTACKGDGSDFKEVSLSDYKGKWLVLFFYPLDFTIVWPTEITGFSERIEEFKKENADILAVSVDSQFSHQAWINGDLGKINYPLASDMTKQVASNYGVLLEEEGITLRGLFIIDPEGKIRYSVVQDNDIGRSVDETLRVLKALKTGGLCPLNWDEGDDLL
jgi:peroxiredoxin 2/4